MSFADVAARLKQALTPDRTAVEQTPVTTVTDDDVYWQMTWGPNFPDKPAREMMFEEEKALARLLADGVIFLNSYWWEDEWPDAAKLVTSLNVNCNDVFAWGCADGESLEYADIRSLYDEWTKNRRWGPAVWCAKKRNQKPQPPVINAMKAAGVWDETMESLGQNYQDAQVQEAIGQLRAQEANKA